MSDHSRGGSTENSLPKQYIVAKDNGALNLCCGPDGGLSFGAALPSREIAYLIEFNGDAFLVASGEIQAAVKVHAHGELFSLANVISRKIYSTDPRTNDQPNNFSDSCDIPAAWEMFELTACPYTERWVERYSKIYNSGMQAAMDELARGAAPFDPNFMRIMALTTGPASIAKLLENGPYKEALSAYVISSLKECRFTIEFLKHQLERPSADHEKIGLDLDWLAAPMDMTSLDCILNSAFRLAVTPSKRSCIVATARNEGVYLIEWIAYHLELGFEKIFLYTNNNTDGSTELVQELHNAGLVEMIESDVGEGGNAQNKAYSHALKVNSAVLDYEWAAFMDIDEFVVINRSKFNDINDFLRWHNPPGSNVIALTWTLMANNEAGDHWIDEPVTSRISKASPFQTNQIKCISRPREMCMSGPHYPTPAYNIPLKVLNADRK